MEVINKLKKLYNFSSPITELVCGTLDYSIFKNDGDIRFCNSASLLSHIPTGSDKRISAFHSFVNSDPYFWMLPLKTAKDSIYGFVLKSYTRKQYRNVFCNSNISAFYGWKEFGDFKTNYPIILTEGVKDCIVLKKLYPFSLACLTTGLHGLKDYEIIRSLTDKVVLAYDNDSAGRVATEKNFKKLQEFGIKVQKAYYPTGDIGELHNNLIGQEVLRNSLKQAFQNF